MKNLINFFKNIYLFRKDLWNNRGYDAMFSLEMFNTSLKEVHRYIKSNNQVSFHLEKRINRLEETIALIDKIIHHDYLDVSKIKNNIKFDGEKSFSNQDIINSRFSELSNESVKEEEKDWSKLFSLLKSNHYGIRSWWG